MNQMQLQMPSLSRFNKVLIITTVALFLLDSILGKVAGISLASIFGLSAAGLSNGFIFQLVTYPLIEKQLLPVIFNALLLWFLGSELENQWGMKRYIQFLLAAVISAAVIYSFIGITFLSDTAVYSFSLTGMQGIGAALCLAYVILYPNRSFMFMMIFPMKAKWFCGLLIAMELYTGFFSPMAAQAWGHLAAMFGGFVMMVWFSRARMPSVRSKKAGQFSFKMEKKKGKAHLSLVEEEESDKENRPPKYWQ